jgi:hypothetical protein
MSVDQIRAALDTIDATPRDGFIDELESHLVAAWTDDADLDMHDADVGDREDVSGTRRLRRRWLLVAAATIAVLALGLLAVAAADELDSVQTDTVPVTTTPSTTPAPSTNPAPTAPSTSLPATAPPSAPNVPAGTEVVNTTLASIIEESTTVEPAMAWNARTIEGDATFDTYPDSTQVAGNGPLVAWNERAGLWLSDDSLTWRRSATQPGATIIDATASDGRIALIGQMGSSVVVMTSDDGGAEWNTLPLADSQQENLGTWFGSKIAIGNGVVLATIGVEGEGAVLFVSTDGAPFQRADLPVDVSYAIQVVRSGGEFLAMTGSNPGGETAPGSTLWRSANGVGWTIVGATPLKYGAAAFGKVGDLYVLVPRFAAMEGYNFASEIWLGRNGDDWVKSDLGGLISGTIVTDDMGVGPSPNDRAITGFEASIDGTGVTLVGITESAGKPQRVENGVVFVNNGNGHDPWINVYDEATGAEIGQDMQRLIDLGFEVLDADGNVRATFTAEDFGQMLPMDPAQLVILHSDDGIAWSRSSINELVGGRPASPLWITTIDGATSIGIPPVRVGDDDPVPFDTITILITNPSAVS